MRKRILFLIGNALLFSFSLSGQCPDRDSLWKRIIYLKHDTLIPLVQKLNELQKDEGRVRQCPYANDSTHALLLKEMGVICYKLAEFPRAVQYTRQAIAMIETHAPRPLIDQNRLIYCYCYYNLQTFYDSLDQIRERNIAIDSCISIASRSGLMDYDMMLAFEKKVHYFFNVGDYQRCIRYIDLGEMLTRQYFHARDSLSCAIFFICWRANVLIFYKKYILAENLLFSKIGYCKKEDAKIELAFLYAELAYAYLYSPDYRKALPYFHQALLLHKETGDFLNCKITLDNMASAYLRNFHDDRQALRYGREALSYNSVKPWERTLDNLQSVDVLGGIAMVYLQRENYDSCFACFQLAFDRIRPGIREEDLLHVPIAEFSSNRNMDLVIDLLMNKGDACKQLYRSTRDRSALSAALRIYKTTDQFLDRLKTEQSEMQSFLFWREASQRLYEHAIEICWLAGKPEDAFYFFERSRSVLLNDQLNELHALRSEDILKLAEVKREILDLERGNGQTERVNALFNSVQELDRLEEQARQRNPLYRQNASDTGLARLADVRRNLMPDHKVLLELFNGDSAVYSMLVTTQQTRVRRIVKKDFDSTVNLYLSYISDPARQNRHFAGYTQAAYHLYNLIFEGMPIPAGRIIISPEGHYFPFEALVLNDNPLSPVYFMDDHAISYAYSARYLLNDHPSPSRESSGSFLGVAPLQYPAAFQLPALNGSDVSLGRIGDYFSDAHGLVAAEASRGNFLRQFSGYKIIQLYTHAADSSSNGEPVIYFADSALYLSDLIPKDQPATRLIILSACETGNGRLYQGEGVFSFNRGFAALGIPSSITNLWMADNESTYRLTELFYKELARGLPQDIALQQAKLEFRRTASEESKLPYYWAATILAGRTDPIAFDKPHSRVFILLFTLLAALLTWRIWKYFRTRGDGRQAARNFAG